jgi:hypothetical protein
VESPSSSKSDEEEVDLGDSERDSDWDEVTDDVTHAGCLYLEGLLSDDHK